MIKKIISGGQTGADRGGLLAARELGVATGGFLPRGCRCEDGAHPEFLAELGMEEHSSTSYVARTIANIKSSDGTLVVAASLQSPGSKLTVNTCTDLGKPCWIATFHTPPVPKLIADWIRKNEITVLNVAGNRESKRPGIQDYTQKLVKDVLAELDAS